jgi:hypothetical protein
VVAFITSIILGVVVLFVPFRWAMKRRPSGASLSWGEAMVASTWAFFVMFWWYGVIPHQWLTWADNELGWRSDKLLVGGKWFSDTQGVVEQALPFQMNWLIIRDFIAVGIYGVALAGNVALWAQWQNRGKKKATTDVVVSGYGRPLAKPGATTGA